MAGDASEPKAGRDDVHQENNITNELSEAEKQIEKRLVRKLDLLILPLIVLSFFLNCIDRY
jgi:hypothetical protein